MKILAFATCAFLLPAVAGAATCDALAASLKLTNARVTRATAITGGQFTPPAAAGTSAPKAITMKGRTKGIAAESSTASRIFGLRTRCQ